MFIKVNFYFFCAAFALVVGFFLAVAPKTANASLYSNISCASLSDSAKTCGGMTDFYTDFVNPAKCIINGPDVTTSPLGAQIRILAGQQCVVGSGADYPGYYTTNIGCCSPWSPITALAGYDGSGRPPNWSYNKTPFISDFASAIPSGEINSYSPFGNPFEVAKFFPGAQSVDVYFASKDDKAEVTINGSTFGQSVNQCNGIDDVNNFSPGITYGTNNFVVSPGDTLTLKVFNMCRPNNGTADWANGSTWLRFYQVTNCYTAAYIAYMNSIGSNYQDVVDYHPTASGVCSPATPATGAQWQSGNATTSVTIPAGSGSTQNFDYGNNGETNSKEENMNCVVNLSGAPAGISASADCPSTESSN